MDRTNRNEDKPPRNESHQNPPSDSATLLTPLTAEQIDSIHRRLNYFAPSVSVIDRIWRVRERHPEAGGLVYFLQCCEFVKIGHTTRNVLKRAAEINSPFRLRVIHTMRGPKEMERDLHRALKHLRHRSEWFHFTEEFQAAFTADGDGEPSAGIYPTRLKREPSLVPSV